MKLHITHIQCNVNDEFDGDEIYLRFGGKKIWPEKLFKGIKTGEILPVNTYIEIPGNKNVCVELWEYDLLTQNDFLGTFDMVADQKGGPFQTSLKLNDQDFLASYLLTWEAGS